MGCDIHLHTEVKINGTWHHYNSREVERDYELFTKMAGVRGDGKIKPISYLRGLPNDVSFLTKFICDDYGVDGHSHSWLSSSEMVILADWQETRMRKLCPRNYYSFEDKVTGYIFGGGWDMFDSYPEDLTEGLEDARAVFWFDN